MTTPKPAKQEPVPKLVGVIFAILLIVGVGNWLLNSCSGSDEKSNTPSDTAEVTDFVASDREYFESNVKYDVLEVLENRGATAPVIEEWSCTWSSDTTADCSGTGYDNAPDLSKCGYELLPCGPFALQADAVCDDPKGRECEIGLNVTSRSE